MTDHIIEVSSVFPVFVYILHFFFIWGFTTNFHHLSTISVEDNKRSPIETIRVTSYNITRLFTNIHAIVIRSGKTSTRINTLFVVGINDTLTYVGDIFACLCRTIKNSTRNGSDGTTGTSYSTSRSTSTRSNRSSDCIHRVTWARSSAFQSIFRTTFNTSNSIGHRTR